MADSCSSLAALQSQICIHPLQDFGAPPFPISDSTRCRNKTEYSSICCPWLSSRENFQNYAFCSKILCQKGFAHGFLCSAHLGHVRESCRRWGWLGHSSAKGIRKAGEFLPSSLQ